MHFRLLKKGRIHWGRGVEPGTILTSLMPRSSVHLPVTPVLLSLVTCPYSSMRPCHCWHRWPLISAIVNRTASLSQVIIINSLRLVSSHIPSLPPLLRSSVPPCLPSSLPSSLLPVLLLCSLFFPFTQSFFFNYFLLSCQSDSSFLLPFSFLTCFSPSYLAPFLTPFLAFFHI